MSLLFSPATRPLMRSHSHHPLPALADERDHAVEVEQGVADAAPLDVGVNDLDVGAFEEAINTHNNCRQ